MAKLSVPSQMMVVQRAIRSPRGVVGVEAEIVRLEVDFRIDRVRRHGGGCGLGLADTVGGVGDLALEVGQLQAVVIDDADGAGRRPRRDTGSAAEPRPPAPITRTRAAFSFAWPVAPPTSCNRDVPGVAADFCLR